MLGPTAVGKTRLVVQTLSDRFEIISCDSRQVYRHLDIGSAKPSRDERGAVPHHLIDIIDPDEQYTAGRFVADCLRLVPKITESGRTPLLVGGTGYYARSFVFGLPGTPPSSPEVRRDIQSQTARVGLESMHAELARVDPVAARRISVSDRYRIERALEVFTTAGSPISSFSAPTTHRRGFRFLLLGIQRERSVLYDRINRRVDTMFHAGLLEETVRALRSGYSPSAPGLNTIGYRELIAMRSTGCETLRIVSERIKRNTRRYAKRQLTYLRGFPGLEWYDSEDEGGIKRRIDEFLELRSVYDSSG